MPLFRNYKVLSVMVFAIVLVLIHFQLQALQKREQRHFAQLLLERSDHVAAEIINALKDTKHLAGNQCDEELLDELRTITNSYPLVYDVGVLSQERLACSANWGMLKRLSGSHNKDFVTPGGFSVYSDVPNFFPIDIRLNGLRRDNFMVFIQPDVLDAFANTDAEFSYGVKAKKGDLEYFSRESDYQKLFPMPVQRLRTEICSELYSHCAYVTQAKSGIFNVSPAAFSLIVILTFVFSYTGVFALSAYLGRRRSIEFRLKHAVHCNKIYMEYQPILSVKTGEISGVEGLIRWRDEVFGQVSPELFIPIATEIGLYPRMSMQAIESALRDLSPILQKNRQIVYALNVDEFEIQSENFFSNLRLLLEKYSVYPKQIKIEITERINLPVCDLASFSKRAKDNGCEVALDDFGTGVANLVWLTEIDFDAIKIDRIFTQALNNDLKKQMVLPIISMINSLNKLVVFEGVENHEEAEIISQLGENYHMQGWYFYRPMGIEALRSLFE